MDVGLDISGTQRGCGKPQGRDVDGSSRRRVVEKFDSGCMYFRSIIVINLILERFVFLA